VFQRGGFKNTTKKKALANKSRRKAYANKRKQNPKANPGAFFFVELALAVT
jgi:hypothetical protein